MTTNASYDIIGQLLGLNTASGESNLLSLSYGYDQASNRVAMVAGGDTFDYDLDASNRLVDVCLNRFVERLPVHFKTGIFSNALLDPSSSAISLLSIPTEEVRRQRLLPNCIPSALALSQQEMNRIKALLREHDIQKSGQARTLWNQKELQ